MSSRSIEAAFESVPSVWFEHSLNTQLSDIVDSEHKLVMIDAFQRTGLRVRWILKNTYLLLIEE